jgi:hypothetical protein
MRLAWCVLQPVRGGVQESRGSTYFITLSLKPLTLNTHYSYTHIHSVAFQMRCGAPARHLLVCLVALAELAEVAAAPSVQRSTVGDGSGMKATARDEADALAA